jgi:hypothetical protein
MKKRLTCLIATFGLVIVTATLLGCGGSQTTASLSAAEIISQSSAQMQALNAYHFVLDQTGGGTPIGMGVEMKKAEGDIVRPDKLKTTITGTAMGISVSVQIISVGGVLKMTNPLNGKWETPPASFNVLSLFDPNTGIAAILKGLTGAAKLEDAQAGGVPCYHLSGSIKSEDLKAITGSAAQGTAIVAEIWIGRNDFLIRDVKLTGQITETEVAGIVRTLSLSNFNAPVTIDLPQ